jgi:2-oxoglutarate ferredoxin oxidoreductase subunit beta
MEGMKTKVQTFGVLSEQMNPLTLAIAMDASFVARGFSGDMEFLKELMKEAIRHKGLALLDILQPCVTFNKLNTFKWYKERVYRIEDDYNPEDRVAAFARSLEWGDKIPTGVIFRNNRPIFHERMPIIKDAPLVKQDFDPEKTLKALRKELAP